MTIRRLGIHRLVVWSSGRRPLRDNVAIDVTGRRWKSIVASVIARWLIGRTIAHLEAASRQDEIVLRTEIILQHDQIRNGNTHPESIVDRQS